MRVCRIVAAGSGREGLAEPEIRDAGIAIDHFAALVIDAGNYEVIAPKGRNGSVEGQPGVWRKTVVRREVRARAIPKRGKVSELLQRAAFLSQDPGLADARAANPDEHD